MLQKNTLIITVCSLVIATSAYCADKQKSESYQKTWASTSVKELGERYLKLHVSVPDEHGSHWNGAYPLSQQQLPEKLRIYCAGYGYSEDAIKRAALLEANSESQDMFTCQDYRKRVALEASKIYNSSKDFRDLMKAEGISVLAAAKGTGRNEVAEGASDKESLQAKL